MLFYAHTVHVLYWQSLPANTCTWKAINIWYSSTCTPSGSVGVDGLWPHQEVAIWTGLSWTICCMHPQEKQWAHLFPHTCTECDHTEECALAKAKVSSSRHINGRPGSSKLAACTRDKKHSHRTCFALHQWNCHFQCFHVHCTCAVYYTEQGIAWAQEAVVTITVHGLPMLCSKAISGQLNSISGVGKYTMELL